MKHFSTTLLALCLIACSPTVKVQAPDKPIVIDLNVNIEHNVRVKIDKELDTLMKNDDLF